MTQDFIQGAESQLEALCAEKASLKVRLEAALQMPHGTARLWELSDIMERSHVVTAELTKLKQTLGATMHELEAMRDEQAAQDGLN